jgi:AcrR family transcriptional regulator
VDRPDRRAQIVTVAFQLIAQRGLEGLRFGDIARAAGINNGTLLYYFASKEVLIQAVGAYLVQQFSATDWPGSVESSDPRVVLQHEFVDARERLGSDLGVVYTELLARAHRDPAIAQVLRDVDANWHRYLTGILERGRSQGAFRADMDADLVATVIMASIRGAGVQALVAGDSTALVPVLDAFAQRIQDWITLGD